MSSSILTGFPPVVGDRPTVLLLGSMPSTASLAAGRYYGHPRNRFWPLMAALFPDDAHALLHEDFSVRYEALKAHRIALWDTLGRCRRKGSLDSAIREGEPNDFLGLLDRCPSVQIIAFNGKKSEAVWKKVTRNVYSRRLSECRLVTLPSSSPANAAWTMERLTEVWRKGLGC